MRAHASCRQQAQLRELAVSFQSLTLSKTVSREGAVSEKQGISGLLILLL